MSRGVAGNTVRCCRAYLDGWQSVQARAPITLQAMRTYVNAALRDQQFVDFARSLVRAVQPRDELGQARTLRAWLAQHFQFIKDPDGIEDVRDPRYMVTQILKSADGKFYGDCDDAAVLAAALGKAIGLPAQFVAVAFQTNGPFRHVLTLLFPVDRTAGQRVTREMDVTKPSDITPPRAARELVVNV